MKCHHDNSQTESRLLRWKNNPAGSPDQDLSSPQLTKKQTSAAAGGTSSESRRPKPHGLHQQPECDRSYANKTDFCTKEQTFRRHGATPRSNYNTQNYLRRQPDFRSDWSCADSQSVRLQAGMDMRQQEASSEHHIVAALSSKR